MQRITNFFNQGYISNNLNEISEQFRIAMKKVSQAVLPILRNICLAMAVICKINQAGYMTYAIVPPGGLAITLNGTELSLIAAIFFMHLDLSMSK